MSAETEMFNNGSKVVISPDKMRAWVILAPPKGVRYTAAALAAWLPQQGVVFGASNAMMEKAVAAREYDELLEVARGEAPVPATGGDYTLRVEIKPFTGLRGGGDGALHYDDLSFLQQAQPGQVLADIIPATEARPGRTVTGEEIPAGDSTPGRQLAGSGFELRDGGTACVAPGLSHISLVNGQLVVTPLLALEKADPQDGPVDFEGNVLVEGDVLAGASIKASGSVFVAGRAELCTIEAGNNALFSGGVRSPGGRRSEVTAGGNVWGLVFESCDIKAGGEICSTYLTDCVAVAGGRANILGGRAAVEGTRLTAKDGVVAGVLGAANGGKTVVSAGLAAEQMERFATVEKRTQALELDLNALRQNMAAHERINRMRADKGRGDAAYKEMATRLKQQTSVLNILAREHIRLKRTVETSTTIAVVARQAVWPGVTVTLNGHPYNVSRQLGKTRFSYAKDRVEANEIGG